MLRIGIIGAGRIAHVHARSTFQHPETELAIICDPIESAAKSLAEQYNTKYSTNVDEVFTNKDVDALIICSPTDLHIPHIIKAIENNKPALCEKPVASSMSKLEELGKYLNDNSTKVMIGFNRRFDPAFAKVHKFAEEGKIGEVEQLTIISRDPQAPPKEYIAVSGGIFKDMTIHDFDMARFFLGDIVEVNAVGQNLDPELKDTGDFDAAVITMKSSKGYVATIINSRHCATGYDQRLEAFGPKGSIFAENIHPTTIKVSTKEYANANEPYLDFFLERYEAAYMEELKHFIGAIKGENKFSPSINDGIEALKIAEIAEQSAKSGKVIKL